MDRKKKRLAYVAPDFFPKNKAAAVRSAFFVDELSKKYDVTVFTEQACFPYRGVCNVTALPSNKERAVVRLTKELLYGLELFVRILFTEKKDLYIISSPPFFVTLLAYMAAKIKNRKRVVLDVRDIYPRVLFAHGILREESIVGRLLSGLEKRLYRGAWKILTVTEGLREFIAETLGEESEKIFILRNGFDERYFLPSPEKFPRFTLVFHGTLGYFQNVDLLAKVIRKMERESPDTEFLVIGSGSREETIRTLRSENLRYHREIPYEEVPRLVARAHLGLSFRTEDEIARTSIPVKVYEYIGLGIPMVVTPVSEAGRIVEENGMGLQCTNDVEAVLEAIRSIRAEYERFAAAVLEQRPRYSRQFQSRELLRILSGESSSSEWYTTNTSD